MVSALGQNDRYNRYISAFLERLLRVTAELIEMAQYFIYARKVLHNPSPFMATNLAKVVKSS